MSDAPLYCDCQFCREFADPPQGPKRIFWETHDFVLLSSVGCFTPGYCLLMPRKHIRSFAELAGKDLKTALAAVEEARTAVTEAFGPAIIAEHGPGEPGMVTSSCCDHAHWHIIPTEIGRVCEAYESIGGRPHTLDEIEALQEWRGRSYIYLSPLRHVRWIWPDSEAFGHQFARRVCAKIAGLEALYDWGVFPFTENMWLTSRRLSSELSAVS